MTDIVRTRTIAGPCADVWAVLADFGAISTWASNVEHSCLLRSGALDDADDIGTGDSGNAGHPRLGIGTVRRVQIGRMTLLERILTWDEPSTLAYAIEGLPSVVRSLRNTWQLEPAGTAGTTVTLTSTIDCGPRPPQRLVARLLGRRLGKDSDTMLDGLAAHLQERTHA